MPKNDGAYGEDFGDEFQQHILAVAARHPGFVIRFRTALDHEYFVSDLHRQIAKALLEHVDEFRELPTKVTLLESIKHTTDDETFEHICAESEKLWKRDIKDAEAVSAKAIEFGKQQAMVNAVLDAANEIDKGNRQIAGLIHTAELVGEDLMNIGIDWIEDVEERAEFYKHAKEVALEHLIPTGLTHLDELMGGGLGRQELGVVLAPPKRGKTTSLVNIGFGAVMRGYNVLHYSCEIQKKKVAARYDDRLASFLPPPEKESMPTITRKVNVEKFANRLKSMMAKHKKEKWGKLVIQSYPTRTATATKIRAHATLMQSRGLKPDLIIVDYADIMRAERRLGEMRHEQAGIYEDLRAIGGEFDCAVWTASQAKQSALEKENLKLNDFAEAFEKAAIVDAAIGFCQTFDEKVQEVCRFVALGLRDEEDGRTVRCNISRKKCMIESTELVMTSFSEESEDDGADPDGEADPVVQKGSPKKKAAKVKLKKVAALPAKKKPKKGGPTKKVGK
jgi:replicative DNA helicase